MLAIRWYARAASAGWNNTQKQDHLSNCTRKQVFFEDELNATVSSVLTRMWSSKARTFSLLGIKRP